MEGKRKHELQRDAEEAQGGKKNYWPIEAKRGRPAAEAKRKTEKEKVKELISR